MGSTHSTEVKGRYIPLLVDLDGALLATDTLFESALLFLKDSPLRFYMLIIWLLQGKQVLKGELAKRTSLAVDSLPVRQEVAEFLEGEAESGRELILLSGSWHSLAGQAAGRFGIFSDVIATDSNRNMTGPVKAGEAVERWGEKGFDYLGNEKKDLAIWQVARRAIVVGSESLATAARQVTEVEKHFAVASPGLRTWLKGIRLHQWAKNGLVFVPLLTSHNLSNPEMGLTAMLAFVAIGMVASATYLVNDLMDLHDDRLHAVKRARPLASGAMSITAGVVSALLLLAGGLLLSLLLLNDLFLVTLLFYLFLTTLYSFVLKRYQTFDVITLATLFTVRIIAGAVAIGVYLSFWLLCFSMFLFLSLAMVKRVSELVHLEQQSTHKKAAGRGYDTSDIVILQSLGGASGFMSVMVFALYINSEQVVIMYSRPEILWLVAPVLSFWIMHIWVAAARGEVLEDPISYAMRDRSSWLVAIAMFLIFTMAALL